MRLLPKGFAQLLPIVQWLVGLHLGYIEEAARGTLAYVIRRAQRGRGDCVRPLDLRGEV